MVESKVCAKCGNSLPSSEFYPRKDRRNGLSSRCKNCLRGPALARSKAHYYANREKKLAYAKVYGASLAPETKRKYSREYSRRNRARNTASMKAWRKANPEAAREHVRSRRAKMAALDPALILGRFEVYGNCCAYCGASGQLEADHVIPLRRGGQHIAANIRPACRTCNASKAARPLAEWLSDPSRLTGQAA